MRGPGPSTVMRTTTQHFERSQLARGPALLVSALLALLPGCFLLSSDCSADWLGRSDGTMVSRTPHPAIVRIISLENSGTSYGSGTLIARQGKLGIVISNWHVVRDADGDILVSFPGGFRSTAKVIRSDRTWDLAALLTWVPEDVTPVTLANELPRPGQPLAIAGYGTGSFRAVAGTCQQYVSPGINMPSDMIQLSAVARQGDSGGPILTRNGELAGVLFGAGWRTTSGSHVGRVRWFLEPVLTQLKEQPAQLAKQGQLAEQHGNQQELPSLPAISTNGARKLQPIARRPQIAQELSVEAGSPGSSPSPITPAENKVPLDWESATLLTSVSADQQPVVRDQTDSSSSDQPPADQTAEADAGQTRLHWKDLLGHSWPEQLKSLLAAIGVIAIVVQLARR